jgi:hypothetical protein
LVIRAIGICTLVAAFYALFYARVIPRWAPAVEFLLARTSVLRRHPRRDIDAVTKLVCAGVAQLGFAALCLVLAGIHIQQLALFAPAAWGLAVALGLLELGTAVALCTAVIEVGVALERRRGAAATASAGIWLAVGRGGWMAQFTTASRVMRPPWWVALVTAYVLGEEVVFRGVVISALRPAGAVTAIGVSTTLFLAAQVTGTTDLRGAIPALSGSMVIGLVHGTVFYASGDLITVVLAHVVFLVAALATVWQPESFGVRS